MKIILRSIAVMLTLVCLMSFSTNLVMKPINGAWKLQDGSTEQVLILSDGYFMHTTFDKQNKKLHASRGGLYHVEDDQISTTIEFNIENKDLVGQVNKYTFRTNGNRLTTDLGGKNVVWTLLDDGTGPMAGTWRSSGRMQDGKVVMSPPRARKTFKLLSGSRFQWAAINAETREFFGTGGGSYTYKDGKYTENIEFFSRDSSRVGASLTFDGKIVDGKHWHHSGLNSKGAELYEIWSKEQ